MSEIKFYLRRDEDGEPKWFVKDEKTRDLRLITDEERKELKNRLDNIEQMNRPYFEYFEDNE